MLGRVFLMVLPARVRREEQVEPGQLRLSEVLQ
jgi:hypothetical protein